MRKKAWWEMMKVFVFIFICNIHSIFPSEIVREKGLEHVTVDDLVAEITPKGRALVPDAVKKELLQRIKTFLAQQSADDLWSFPCDPCRIPFRHLRPTTSRPMDIACVLYTLWWGKLRLCRNKKDFPQNIFLLSSCFHHVPCLQM